MNIIIGQGSLYRFKLSQQLEPHPHLPVFAGSQIFAKPSVLQEYLASCEHRGGRYRIPIAQYLLREVSMDCWNLTSNALVIENADAGVNKHSIGTNACGLPFEFVSCPQVVRVQQRYPLA